MQIQAYLDNIFDVGAMLEDAENRGGVLDHVEDLQEHNAQVRDGTQITRTSHHRGQLETQSWAFVLCSS